MKKRSGLTKAENLVLDILETNGGNAGISTLERDPELAKELGRGLYAEDLVYEMQSRGLIAYDHLSGEVKISQAKPCCPPKGEGR